MTTRYYTNTASQATLASGVGTTDTTITLTAGSYSGYPTSFPFSAAIARGTSSEELVLVTAASGNTLTVTRGYDSSTVSAHGAGSTFVHVITAQDLRDVQAAAAAADAANTAAGAAQTTANNANTAAGAAQTTATTALNKYRGVADATARTALTGLDPDTLVLQESDQSLWAWVAGAWKQASSSAAAPAIPLSDKGAAGGVATLDGNGQVPAAQIPSSTPTVTTLSTGVTYWKSNGVVTVLGSGTPGSTPALGTLPVGFRPSATIGVGAVTSPSIPINTGAACAVSIASTGVVTGPNVTNSVYFCVSYVGV